LLEIDLLEGKTLEMFTVVAVGWLLKKNERCETINGLRIVESLIGRHWGNSERAREEKKRL